MPFLRAVADAALPLVAPAFCPRALAAVLAAPAPSLPGSDMSSLWILQRCVHAGVLHRYRVAPGLAHKKCAPEAGFDNVDVLPPLQHQRVASAPASHCGSLLWSSIFARMAAAALCTGKSCRLKVTLRNVKKALRRSVIALRAAVSRGSHDAVDSD